MGCVYKILIVDDSRSIRALLEEIISSSIENIKVSSVPSAQAALEYMANHDVELILLDIYMPAMDGFEFARILREDERYHQIPVIFITASSNTDEFIQKGFDLGAIDYIKKPFDEVILVNKIRSYVKLFKQERELKKAYTLIYKILSHMDNLICIISHEEIVQANETFLRFFGFANLEELQKKHSKVSDFFVLEEDALNNEISNEKLIEHLLRNHKKDTKIKLYDQSLQEEKTFILKISSLHKDKKGEYILSLTDITETERLKKSYQLQAILDPLTKIYNRQAFNDKYPKEFYYAKTKEKELRLLMADIDYFKKINDTYGHQIGDYVLKEFCKIINLLIPNNYFFARWGGEEFIIIAQDDTLENVMHYAQKIRKAVEDFEFLHVGKVTVSLGVASLRKEDEENSFLARVDEALYKAKQEGRNRVVNL